MPNSMSTRLKILVAEDNDINRMVITTILGRSGVAFDIARDGVEAVERFQSDDYALVLMDCQMPNLSGLEATRKIRDLEASSGRGRCPIIALTANAMKGDRDRCLEAGMDDFLAKPFKSRQLVDVLSNWKTLPNPQGDSK